MAGMLTFSRFSLIEAYWTDAWMAGLIDFSSYYYDLHGHWCLDDTFMVSIPCAQISIWALDMVNTSWGGHDTSLDSCPIRIL